MLVVGSEATVPAAARRPLRLIQSVIDPRRNRAAACGEGVGILRSRGAILFIALVLLASACASAQGAVELLVFDLSPAVQYGYPLDTLTFDGALTNLGPGVTITTVTFLAPPELLADASPYTAGWCEYVPYMSSKSGPLFDVTIAAGTAPGTYDGTVQLGVLESTPTAWLQSSPLVQDDPCETVSAKFEVIVRGEAVPEASALALGVLGASSLGAWLRLRKR